MQRKQNAFTTILAAGFCAALALSALSSQAQDAKPDPNGTWKWTAPGRGGNPGPEVTLKLKAEGEKLTGTLTLPPRGGTGDPIDAAISDGKFKGDAISFSVVRDIQGNMITNKYEGKISGDTIKGTQPAGRGRRGGAAGADTGAAPAPTTQPWEAKRSK
jgi:hypothetical protein